MTPDNPHGASRRSLPLRRGSILACVIVCMAIAAALATAGVRSAISQRRQARVERQLRQVELLLEAGARRAVARLEDSPAYRGETWLLNADSLPGFESAGIEIEAAADDDDDELRNVRIVASLPADSVRQVRRTFTFVIRPSDLSTIPEE